MSGVPDRLAGAFGLAGKTALVTGGGSGLGLATAKCFAAAGARVIIAGRRADLLNAALPELGDHGAAEVLDLADIASLAEAAKAIVARHGVIDILVNNAGNMVKKPFEE